MKKTILIIAIIITGFACNAQENTFNLEDLTINSVNILHRDTTFLVQNFGQPLN